jgi:ATP-dependent helicase/nuclease subunit A
MHSVAELADHFDDWIKRGAEFDGIPARPHDGSAVRLMNLHKVKGLEAPIVFLADPTGKWDPPVDLHVDRSGDKVRGYMAIYRPSKGRKAQPLAQPAQWDQLSAVEQRFHQAEESRLMYVAATRGGTQLAVTRKEQRNDSSYWQFFSESLRHAVPLTNPGPQAVPAGPQVFITDDDVESAERGIATRHETIARPTYATAAAKEISLTPSGLHGLATGGEHGTEWGTVIHFLLQAAATRPELDLHDLAYTALVEQQIDPGLAETAVQLVHRVMVSDVWRRAASSAKRLVEVPFARCLASDQTINSVPTILRGVIDLAFREPAGWVIVDYKTDARSAEALPALVAHYSGQVRTYSRVWAEIVEQAVVESGLYFTHLGQYVTL